MSANPISLAVVAVLAGFGVLFIALTRLVAPGGLLIVLAVNVLAALKMARQGEQAVVLRAGEFLAVRGPGLFWIVPILDNIAALIDTRLRTTQFVAEQTLTKDTVPVDVDAIIFWIVTDVKPRHSRSPATGTRFPWRRRPRCAKPSVLTTWRCCCQTAGRRTIIVPSSAVDSMNLGGVAGITSLAQTSETSRPGEPARPPGPST